MYLQSRAIDSNSGVGKLGMGSRTGTVGKMVSFKLRIRDANWCGLPKYRLLKTFHLFSLQNCASSSYLQLYLEPWWRSG